MKLNCDGTVSNLGMMADIGGCIRDENNIFLLEFSFVVGPNYIIGTELQAILLD